MDRRVKVLMVASQLGYGGAETSFIRLANFLSQTMDVQVALFASDYGKGAYAGGHEPLVPSITLLDGTAPCGRICRWWRRILLLRALKRENDVTISFLPGPNLVNVLAGYNACSIISLRGTRIYDPVVSRAQKWLFQHLFDPMMFRLAAHIVPVSAGLVHEVKHMAGLRAAAKAVVISPFVDFEVLQQRLAQLPCEPYGQLKGQPVIVGVGRLSIEKGFQHLIRVFCAVAKQHPGVKLLLVGDGPMLAALKAQCVQAAMVMDDMTPGVSAVIFAGYQKNPLPFMGCARVYAMTSATEGFPNVVLEALAAGLPVVAADTPWGARAILWDAVKASEEPYPTCRPTQADYGVLMPRIDLPEYQDMWAATLSAYLTQEAVAVPAMVQRVHDYDIGRVGAQWQALIQATLRRTVS